MISTLRFVSSLLFSGSCLYFFSFVPEIHSKISDCSSGKSLFQLSDLSLKPDPPVPGQDVDMTVKFNNPDASFTNGFVTTSVTINYIPFSPVSESLCANTECPITTGLNDRSTKSTWPTGVSGKLQTKIVWMSETNNTQLLCIQISTTIANSYFGFLRGYTKYTDETINLIQSTLRLNAPNALRLSNPTYSSGSKTHKHLIPRNPYTSLMVYNTSNLMCFPSEESHALVLWKNVSTA